MGFKLFLMLMVINIIFIEAIEEREECEPTDELLDGLCIKVTECDVALQFIRKKGNHPFKRCFFDGDIEVICCPRTSNPHTASSTTSTTTSNYDPDSSSRITERKSERECTKIMESSTPTLDLHIIGGEIASIGEFPHMVAIGYEDDGQYRFDCGGALVSNTFVLTAAHCIINLERKLPKIIRAGVVDLGNLAWNEETDYRVVANITYPDYKHSSQYNDIALLRLERPIQVSSNLNAACLYSSVANPIANLTITGWGRTSTTRSDKSTMLLKTSVWPVTAEECTPHYKKYRKMPRGVIGEQICAGDPQGGHDACQGDSGGPMQLLVGTESVYRLVGVTSFGRGCGSTVPGIYTRVASYLDWIESIVWPY